MKRYTVVPQRESEVGWGGILADATHPKLRKLAIVARAKGLSIREVSRRCSPPRDHKSVAKSFFANAPNAGTIKAIAAAIELPEQRLSANTSELAGILRAQSEEIAPVFDDTFERTIAALVSKYEGLKAASAAASQRAVAALAAAAPAGYSAAAEREVSDSAVAYGDAMCARADFLSRLFSFARTE